MSSAQLSDFLAALREEEEDHGMSNAEVVDSAEGPLIPESKSANFEQDFKDINILFFASETVGVTHQDVTMYKTQLFNKGQTSAFPERPIARQLLLSDESVGVSSVDRARLDVVLSQLQFDVQPQVRGWTMSGNPENVAAQHFNYGLNEALFYEYLHHQVLLRLNRVARVGLGATVSHAAMGAPLSAGGGHVGAPPPPSQSLYITNFPLEWTQQELAGLFARCGPLESVAVMTGRRGYGTRGAGFVNFARLEDAARAIEQLNGTIIDDFRINVNYARSKTRAPPQPDHHQHESNHHYQH